MLKIQHVALYHPQDVLASRLPGGPDGFAVYVRALQEAMETYYAAAPVSPAARALIVALGPDDQHCFWFMAPQGDPPEWLTLERTILAVSRPAVVGGPVAFAMLCNLGEDFPSSSSPPTPPAWTEVLRAAGKPLSVDSVLAEVLK